MEKIVGTQEFSSMASCRKAVQKVLNSPDCGSELVGEDFIFIMALLNCHPRADYKIGCGIKGIFVELTRYGRRGFYALRNDGTRTDFSYLQCISPSSQAGKVRVACRSAIRSFVVKFRDNYFSTKQTRVCPKTGELIFKGNCVVHHDVNSFEKIFSDWVKEKGIDLGAVKLGGFEDNCESVYFLDKVVEMSFIDFHNERAVLKILSEKGHKLVK